MKDEVRLSEVRVGELVTITGAVEEIAPDGRARVSFDRNGETVKEWFLADELSTMGFDDGSAE